MSFLSVDRYPAQMMLRVHVGIGQRWTCWDMGLMQGGEERRCWGERCTVKVSCWLPRGAFLQLVCSQNPWWKVKVQRGLSIFTRIMLCHSSFPTPLVLPFLSCCPSLGSFMWGQELWFSPTSDPVQFFNWQWWWTSAALLVNSHRTVLSHLFLQLHLLKALEVIEVIHSIRAEIVTMVSHRLCLNFSTYLL